MSGGTTTDVQEISVRKILSKEVLTVISILGLGFGVFNFIVIPRQEDRAQIQYLKAEIEKNQLLNETLTKTQQNDLHTIENQMIEMNSKMEDFATAIVQLKTVIEERVPPKK